MGNVLGIINLINEKQYLKGLTAHRNVASVPFAGRYRLIDFTMSNFINAGISLVGVFPKERYLSVMDHLGSGKEWNMDRRTGGLYILPPSRPHESIAGDMKQFHDHLSFFNRAKADMVVITPGHHVCKMDYNKIIDFHQNSGADITVVYKDFHDSLVQKPIYHTCRLNEAGKVTDISLFNAPNAGDHVALETYVLSKAVLIELIHQCAANEEYDFLKDAVKANLQNLNVQGFHFTGDLPFIHSIESFHASNMKFLNPDVLKSFFSEKGSVFTKINNEAPTSYAETAQVSNSLVANGCKIEGTVENSILFRGVTVKKGAIVRNSVIMQNGEIGEGAVVENVITDKQVRITNKKVVIGTQEPTVIKKSEII